MKENYIPSLAPNESEWNNDDRIREMNESETVSLYRNEQIKIPVLLLREISERKETK